jgi:predicted tellurium resistance membrane protein TerC
MALLLVVAVPMTGAAVGCIRDLGYASELVIGAGLMLVAWIAVELAFIKSYSWFHPTYLGLAIMVLISGWLLERTDRMPSPLPTGHQAEPQFRP